MSSKIALKYLKTGFENLHMTKNRFCKHKEMWFQVTLTMF